MSLRDGGSRRGRRGAGSPGPRSRPRGVSGVRSRVAFDRRRSGERSDWQVRQAPGRRSRWRPSRGATAPGRAAVRLEPTAVCAGSRHPSPSVTRGRSDRRSRARRRRRCRCRPRKGGLQPQPGPELSGCHRDSRDQGSHHLRGLDKRCRPASWAADDGEVALLRLRERTRMPTATARGEQRSCPARRSTQGGHVRPPGRLPPDPPRERRRRPASWPGWG